MNLIVIRLRRPAVSHVVPSLEAVYVVSAFPPQRKKTFLSFLQNVYHRYQILSEVSEKSLLSNMAFWDILL